MVAELQRLHDTITTAVAETEPAEALGLLWLLVDLHPGLIGRTRDKAGRLRAFFVSIVPTIGELAAQADASADVLAEDVFQRMIADPYEIYGVLISTIADALGPDGIATLTARFLAARSAHLETDAKALRDRLLSAGLMCCREGCAQFPM